NGTADTSNTVAIGMTGTGIVVSTNAGSVQLTSSLGTISVTGRVTAGGAGGISVQSPVNINVASAPMSTHGGGVQLLSAGPFTSGAVTLSGSSIDSAGGAVTLAGDLNATSTGINSAGGTISLIADNMGPLTTDTINASTGTVVLAVKTAGTAVAVSSTTLNVI